MLYMLCTLQDATTTPSPTCEHKFLVIQYSRMERFVLRCINSAPVPHPTLLVLVLCVREVILRAVSSENRYGDILMERSRLETYVTSLVVPGMRVLTSLVVSADAFCRDIRGHCELRVV